jgi:hypothetical protein
MHYYDHYQRNPAMTTPNIRQRNNVRLQIDLDGAPVSHFRLREFENRDGLAMINAATLLSLEKLRRDLCRMAGEEVWVIITNALRTHADLERLAKRLGWTDQGGAVSRSSRHLPEYGGIAVDLVALIPRTRTRISQKVLGGFCRRHFTFVKDDYHDGHVHADNR